jgi:multidrug efflux pump subunit AcrA (membrane-fusion protein)
MKIIHELTLDVSRQGVQASVPITQHDTGIHVLLIHLRNGSKEVKLNSSLTATLYLGNDSYEVVTVYTEDGAYPNTLECNVTPYMSSNVGELTAQLQIFEGADRVLSAPEFMLVIKEDRASRSNVLGSTPYAAVVTARDAAQTSAAQAQTSAAQAQTSAAQAQTYATQASTVAQETATSVAQTVASDTAKSAVDEVANTAKNDAIAYVSDNFSNALKGKVSGTVVAMDDVSPLAHKMPIKLSSKNLIPYPYYDTTKTTNGITFTDNGDGSITVKGTATADAYFKFTKTTLDVPVAAPIGVPLRISGGVGSKENNNRITVTARKIKADGTYVSFIDSPHASIEVGQLAEGETLGNISIIVSTGSTVDATIYPQLEVSAVATAYTPYMQEDTRVIVNGRGKNLIPYPYNDTTKTTNGITFTDNGDGGITVKGTATPDAQFTLITNLIIPTGTDVVISGGTGTRTDKKVIVTARKKLVSGSTGNFVDVPSNNPSTGQLKDGESIAAIRLYIEAGVTVDDIVYPQLEFGTVATEYEPYKEGETITTTIADGAELDAIAPNMTIYTDNAGAVIDCSYNRDINIAFEKLTQAIISAGGIV